MVNIIDTDIDKKIGVFAKEIFIRDVKATDGEIECTVKVDNEAWLMNDHFPGTSIIQCFFQCAMLLFYENNKEFDPTKNLFFLGDLKVKYKRPIFLNDVVRVTMKKVCFMSGVLLYEGECFIEDKKCTTISGSLASKPRTVVIKKT